MVRKLKFDTLPCVTGKRQYKNKREALKAVETTNSIAPDRLKNTYKCEKCLMWHNTSLTQKQYNVIDYKKNRREAMFKPSMDVVKGRMEYLISRIKKRR